ncbi:S41 family peptidase [Bordetella avium]|nr:S41 family peptidase [Bordetella avium]AZY47916.1 S41 family peptidase [Bordetella avium]AZY51287.1 S41 family peptidase [Bordetella avium]RIQ14857.1 S41 family peptidase [Bordetella avium]RIQ18651.1 S41 family peptidase [Bordetella avium]RIQ35313.1 S41 family peptidase [Bordetella avium]
MSTRKFRGFGLVATGVVAGVLLSVGVTAVAQRGNPLPLDELRQLTNVFSAIKNNYVEQVDDKALIGNAISGMVSNLDPHSAYLDADAFREMQTATQGEFGGLGIEVGAEDGFVKVISPIEDTPAARAGIMAGDLIIKIDDTPTKGMSLNDAVKLMRGKPKSPITLTIVRADHPQPIVVKIVRDVIKVRSVRSKMLDDGVAYVRIAQFQEKTGSDLARHLRELGAKGAPKGLVLDLRNDPGGLLTSAIGVSGAFLPADSLVVSTDGRTPDSRHKYLATPSEFARGEGNYLADLPEWTKTVPMVVLVNVGSASASEIVAGALQDHKRAKVLGNRTFGKGSVQVILPLSESTAVKLTTSRYFTPSGRSIQATGIEPDYVVADTADGDLFRLPREADLQRHLSNQQTSSEVKSNPNDNTEAPVGKVFEFGGKDDFQLQQAINVLQGKPVQKGSARAQAKADIKPNVSGKTERLTITPSGVEPAGKQ